MKLIHFRKRKHLTQLDLAQKLFLDQTTISKYENGKITPPVEQLPQLAKVLNCSIEDLVNAIIETKKQTENLQ